MFETGTVALLGGHGGAFERKNEVDGIVNQIVDSVNYVRHQRPKEGGKK